LKRGRIGCGELVCSHVDTCFADVKISCSEVNYISEFLPDFVLQNPGLNKIVLVVEITGFWNIIMLLLAQ
jgi:hypothetical protein